MPTANITVQEAEYIDPRAGNDKFYRTFAFGAAWVAQYGRNGTLGTFTKITEAASPEAAEQAASRKFADKVRKGYEPVRSGTVATEVAITADNISVLDELAGSLPAGQSVGVVTTPVPAANLTAARRPDITANIADLLAEVSHWHPVRPAVPADMNPDLPVRPMLASTQSAEAISDALNDPGWFAQYKYDGDRVVVEVTNGDIRVLNRAGQAKVKNVGSANLEPFTALHSGRWVFDGEIVGRTLVLFDLLMATDGQKTWVRDYSCVDERYEILRALAYLLNIPQAGADHAVVIAPMAMDQETKDHFLATAIAEQREGIILRRKLSVYEQGRRSMDMIKHKLIKDADVVVKSLHPTKQSATLAVHDAAGRLVEVGAASTIGKGEVSVGDVWVVTFLYVTNPAHPRLFQPRLVSSRTDKTAVECTLDQFADAGTAKVV
ncbi:ATP-dependent DNA ligase [Arthrobacter koreensis]|uniref:ATP-dependent DNA ligase n=1 Tax=Arthrobacter koreensis TaxID=199136 RepID=UPI0037F51820